jgi:hypothetical protein
MELLREMKRQKFGRCIIAVANTMKDRDIEPERIQQRVDDMVDLTGSKRKAINKLIEETAVNIIALDQLTDGGMS